MRAAVAQVRSFVSGAFRELPVETVAVLAAALSLIVLIQDIDGVDKIWSARIVLAALAVAPLGFSLTLAARAGRLARGAHLAIGALVGAAVTTAVWLALDRGNSEERFVWRYAPLLLAAILSPFPTIALLATPGERFDAFARFLRRFLEQTTIAALLLAASLAAIAVVFVALTELFDLSVQQLGVQTALVAVAVVTLGWLYRLLPDGGSAQVPEIWRRLVTAIGAPFVAVMLAILASYEVWAVCRQELPRNILSPLVIGVGAVGFVCALVIVAILREPGAALGPADRHRWARARSVQVARAFPLALLVLLPMAFWALAIRIDEYGLTPVRTARLYGLIALAVIAVGGSIQYLRRRPPLAWEVPAAIAALAIVAAIGPLSLVSVSLRSQMARVDRLLDAAGVTERRWGATIAKVPLTDESYDAIADRLELIADLGGADALAEVAVGAPPVCHHFGDACLESLGVVRRPGHDPGRDEWSNASVTTAFPVGGRELERVQISHYQGAYARDLLLSLEITDVVVRRLGREIGRASLASLVDASISGVLPARGIQFEGAEAAQLGELFVSELSVRRSEGWRRVESLQAMWLHAPARISP